MKYAEELLKQMTDFEYGWIDKTGYKYVNKIAKGKFITDWYLQNPKDMDKTKIGICWDQVEYERKVFEKENIPHRTIFMIYEDGIKNPMHTFLIFKEKKKYYWFENTYNDVKGINEYNSLEECLSHIKEQFKKENKLEEIGEKLYWYVYEKPKYEIGAEEFVKHCLKSTKVNESLDNLEF